MGGYIVVGAVVLAGILLVVAAGLARRMFAPRAPTTAKLATYESGVDPVGFGWAQTTVRYFVYAYLYVIFAVDAVFLFPWATVFAALGWVSVGEMGVFIGILAVGLVYAWRQGVLTWT